MYPHFPFSQPSVTINHRWLYSLFIAIDANFRLKQKARDIKDPELGSGLAYFSNAQKFGEHLKRYVDENEVRISVLSCCCTENLHPMRSRPAGPNSMP